MNKKGLTLIELIAVIAILGILAIIVGPAVLNIRTMVMANSLDSKIGMIKAAAIEYASDHLMEVVPVTQDNKACNKTCYINKAKDGAVGSCNCELIGTHILVKNLIDQGYLAGDSDDKNVMTNPFSEDPLNFSEVFITYDSADAVNRRIIAYIKDEYSLCPEDEIPMCKEIREKRVEYEIK